MRTIDFVRVTRIRKVIQESSNIRTFAFEDSESMNALPGQFLMVWLPRVGEFPMSLSLTQSRSLASITVKAMGSGSKILYDCQAGDYLGVRGPYGNSFDLTGMQGKNVLLVGGGTGMVPIITLAAQRSEKQLPVRASMVIGAKSKQEMPFLKLARRLLGENNVFPATDNGSLGFHGLAHQEVEELLLKRPNIHTIFSCGPEKMMRAIYDIATKRKIHVQFSLERIMKCGIGICGSCCIGAYVLCKDGPVLNQMTLENIISEFGSHERDKTGTLVPK